MRPTVPTMAKKTAEMGGMLSLRMVLWKGGQCERGDKGRTGEAGEDLFRPRGVLGQASCMSKPTFGCEGKVESDGRYDATGDKEGLKFLGANICAKSSISRWRPFGIDEILESDTRNVGDALALGHRRQARPISSQEWAL